MSSRGNRVLTVRVSPATLAAIDQSIENKILWSAHAPIGRSGWLAIAIREKLQKEERSRKSSRRTKRVRGPKTPKESVQ